MSTPLSNEQQKQRPECGPCGSGDRCLQPWAMLNPEYKCNRCNKVLHQICASIDATKAPEGQFEDPNSIRVCYLCLLPSESPNHLGTTAATENAGLSPPAKKARTDSEGATSFLSPGNVKWDELTKPHESIIGLVNQNKAVAPEASKKTIWWRCFYTWNMKEFGDEVPQPLAYCNLCGKSVKMSKVDRSPTPLKRHLQIHHKELYQTLYQQKLKDGPVISPPAQKRPKNSSTPKDKTTAKMGKKEFIRNKQLQAIVKWIVDTDQPLDVVESESFRNMTATMIFNLRHQNKFSKSAIEEHISSQIRGMRDIIRGLLFNCSIVHVQEYWKTSGGHSYQVDRAFWIDNDFKLRYVALACELAASVPKRDIEESLWKPIGVDSVKQVAVTVGNNASNWLAGSSVSPMFHGLEYDLQQIAKTAYQALGPDVEQILQKVRAIVQKVESSSVVREALEKAQADLKSLYSSDQETVNLILDAVEDSWWSTQGSCFKNISQNYYNFFFSNSKPLLLLHFRNDHPALVPSKSA